MTVNPEDQRGGGGTIIYTSTCVSPRSVELPGAAQSFMAGLQSDLVDEEDVEPNWLTGLEDTVRHGEIRPAVLELPARVLN